MRSRHHQLESDTHHTGSSTHTTGSTTHITHQAQPAPMTGAGTYHSTGYCHLLGRPPIWAHVCTEELDRRTEPLVHSCGGGRAVGGGGGRLGGGQAVGGGDRRLGRGHGEGQAEADTAPWLYYTSSASAMGTAHVEGAGTRGTSGALPVSMFSPEHQNRSAKSILEAAHNRAGFVTLPEAQLAQCPDSISTNKVAV